MMSQSQKQDAQGPPPLLSLEGSSASDMALRKSKSMHSLGNNNILVNAGPGVKVNGPQGNHAMRASASVTSIPSPAPPGFGHFSPLMGHRNTMRSASPLGGGSVAAAAGNSVPQPAGTSSPLLVPKRGVLQQGRGPQRSSSSFTAPSQPQHGSPGDNGVLRQSTPVPVPAKNPEARPRGSTGAQASGHNPSPNMMQRSVSSQALRAGGKPADKAVVRTTGGFAVSPERHRPAGPAPGINPARGMSPQQRAPQR